MAVSRAKDVRYRVEYVGLRAGLLLADSLPLGAAFGLARLLADAYRRLDARRRRLALDNVVRAGVAASGREAAGIVRDSFRSFALTAVESLRFKDYFTAENWRARTELDLPPRSLETVTRRDTGMIIASAHFGNWEVAGKLMSFLTPVTAIARPMNNPYVDRVLQRRSAGTRLALTPKHGVGAGRFIDVLRRGDALALLIDLHARRHAMRIDFFGRAAATHTTPALLHLRTGAPIAFGYCLRTGPMRFRLTVHEPIEPPRTGARESDVRAILTALTRQLEDRIRSHPGQFLWSQRRWR
jgi:KDO2-lipid IV(A) lauroyltransferase